MLVQMGYVVLFSSAFPLAGLCALANNLLEIRSDAFKLAHVHQRPFGQRVANIGTWQNALGALGLAAVIVNSALIGLSGQVSRLWPGLTQTQTVVLIVALEVKFRVHCLPEKCWRDASFSCTLINRIKVLPLKDSSVVVVYNKSIFIFLHSTWCWDCDQLSNISFPSFLSGWQRKSLELNTVGGKCSARVHHRERRRHLHPHQHPCHTNNARQICLIKMSTSLGKRLQH